VDEVEGQCGGASGGSRQEAVSRLEPAPRYVAPTLTYQLGHDHGFKTGQQVSILTLEGRVVVSYTGYARHVTLIQLGARNGAAKLWCDKPRQQFYLLVRREVEVDVGQR
jgi:hypothetical protein